MGRHLTYVRFDTPVELVEYVWRDYERTRRNVSDIVRAARVSTATVNKVLAGPHPAEPTETM
jgi:hypothetical protein